MELPTDFGPKMQACSEKERRFVWEFVQLGCRNATEAARRAGYTDNNGHDRTAVRVSGHTLRNRPRIIEAMQEVGRTHFGGMLAPAVVAIERILLNQKHPDHAKVALAVLAANGLGSQSRVDVNVSGTVEHRAAPVEARIRRAVDRLSKMGRDPAALLAAAEAPVIEGEVVTNVEPTGDAG